MDVSTGSNKYCVDIVLCIDGTPSYTPIITEFKNRAGDIYRYFTESAQDAEKQIEQLRIKFIVFRNYCYDTEPMIESDFYLLPEQQEAFVDFAKAIEAKSENKAMDRQNIKNNSLEALFFAMKSKWQVKSEYKRRQVVTILTDSYSVMLGEYSDIPNYPTDIPKDIEQLHALWEGIISMPDSVYQPKIGRLVAFVPNTEPWLSMQAWNRYWPAITPPGVSIYDPDIMCVFDLITGVL